MNLLSLLGLVKALGKHGCGSKGAAPASDSHQCNVRPLTQLHARLWQVPIFFFFSFSNSGRYGSIQSETGLESVYFGKYRPKFKIRLAWSFNFKRKKKLLKPKWICIL